MTVTDPRERYDDLRVTRSRETLEPEEFWEAANSEAATVGWVVFGFVFDAADRVLLIEQPWADGWMTPGGTLRPGESLSETVTREIEEETGVTLTPIRPHAVDEFTFVNECTDESSGWTAVFFEGVADTTEIDDELGLAGEEIVDAGWFDDLPANVFNRKLTEAVYRRCLDGSTPDRDRSA